MLKELEEQHSIKFFPVIQTTVNENIMKKFVIYFEERIEMYIEYGHTYFKKTKLD